MGLFSKKNTNIVSIGFTKGEVTTYKEAEGHFLYGEDFIFLKTKGRTVCLQTGESFADFFNRTTDFTGSSVEKNKIMSQVEVTLLSVN